MVEPARQHGIFASEGELARPTAWERSGALPLSTHPLAQMRELNPHFARLLDELLGDWSGALSTAAHEATPLAEIEELDNAWLVRVELPGVKQGDIDVQLVGRRLVVRAQRAEERREGTLRRTTRTTGRYFLDIVLPGEVQPDDVEATLEDGVLGVRLPKPEGEQGRARRIGISRPGSKRAAEAEQAEPAQREASG
jgi:HSP20 family protein